MDLKIKVFNPIEFIKILEAEKIIVMNGW